LNPVYAWLFFLDDYLFNRFLASKRHKTRLTQQQISSHKDAQEAQEETHSKRDSLLEWQGCAVRCADMDRWTPG
jgi:hypothetical protein